MSVHDCSAEDDAPDSVSVHGANLCLALSREAASGIEGPCTMKFVGSIQGRDLSILVDSGSSHTFLSQHIAMNLQGVTLLRKPITVQVENGQTLVCDSHISPGLWSIQECSFSTPLKILPLSHFDLVIGMD